MNKFLKISSLVIVLFSSAISQNSGLSEYYYLNGNKIRLSLTADRTLEAENGLVAEWPIGSGHEYLDTMVPFVISGGLSPQVIDWEPIENSGQVFSNRAKSDWPDDWNGSWPG